MTDSRQLIVDEVLHLAERLEEMADDDELMDPLDVKAEINARGDVLEITLVLATGGPHLEVDLFGETVNGWWGGESHSVPVDSDGVRMAADYWEEFFLDVVLA